MSTHDDPRRRTPRTDTVLDDPRLEDALTRLGRSRVKAAVVGALDRCRAGDVAPEDVVGEVVAQLPESAASLRRVINATGIVVHTNLGRAPLSAAAVDAVVGAAGATDVELDLTTGQRGGRGRSTLEALRAAVPAAGDVLVVNNGAGALALVACALASGGEIVVARGELVEIGDGFRIPDLLESVGARLREVGTTNRVHRADYERAIGPDTAFVLKVHPSNFRVEGFVSTVPVADLATLPVPVVADIGSGLLAPHRRLPDEPDAASTLAAGASLVTASGDKLLGGPQCGLVLGDASLVERVRRFPLARALRVDKLTLAALEATLTGPATPVAEALQRRPDDLMERARRIVAGLPDGLAAAVESDAAVGGGGAPGVTLPSAAVSLPARLAAPLRLGVPRWWAGSPATGCCSTSPRSHPRTTRRSWTPYDGSPGPEVHVVATAGHVDHGKSTLVRALTGQDPDRLEEERRRGLSIELGYCWAALPPVGDVAFVDVPGHERFLSTTLSGLGPVPVAMLVVAADDPWMPQAAEHLAALDALAVAHGVVVVTRSDLADPGPALARARAEVHRTSLAGAPAVVVSGRTGAGLDRLRATLVDVLARMAPPDPAADVRLWVDRVFHVRGAGTVVTGTLPAGTLRVGDHLVTGGERVRVRGLESLGVSVEQVSGVARVALRLGSRPEGLARGSVLLTPDAFLAVTEVDVRLRGEGRLPEQPLLNVGAAQQAVHARPLGDRFARLVLDPPLPLRHGDRMALRDPGSRTIWGAEVVDAAPPSLTRRGAGRARATDLAERGSGPAAELAARGVVRRSLLRRLGVPTEPLPDDALSVGDWVVSGERRRSWYDALDAAVRATEDGLSQASAAHLLGLPDAELVGALVAAPLRLVAGRVTLDTGLPDAQLRALDAVRAELTGRPFDAPAADRLAELGIDRATLARLGRSGHLLVLDDGIVVLPGADDEALGRLAELPSPFTTSQARQALGTSRRVALPLLAYLDRTGRTVRLPDDRRRLR
ncbi:L-seryl-tRNA(Sec) selenium transferase [Nocardioides cynanchi]|uniref:L-seryl-tRNA(Sec) selenium transferase n=1 Tax=Nocardioides cynanchi TaxID=2558918 RepID=UPI001EE2E553|nr:L-seryl-tRNA(Sec) selenium transferase [Nocardioides cynanchi]